MSTSNDASADTSEIHAYWRYRSLTTRALVVFAAALVGALVFRTPLAWGDGKVATLVLRACAVVAPLAAVLAFRWNAKTAELSGYFRGKHGGPPPRLN